MSEAPKRRRSRVRAIAATVALAAAPIALVGIIAAPAGATTVTTETEFRNAWGNSAETSIVLGANITLTCGGGGTVTRNSTVAVVVSGGGTHSITQTCADTPNLVQGSTGLVTLAGVTISGGNAGITSDAGPVTLLNSTVTNVTDSATADVTGVLAEGNVVLDGSTVSGLTGTGGDANGVGSLGGNVSILNGSRISGIHLTGNNGAAFGAGAATGGITVDSSTISDVTAASTSAAGVFSGGAVSVARSSISGISGTTAFGAFGVTSLTASQSTVDGVTGHGDPAFGLGGQGTAPTTVTGTEVTNVTSDDVAVGVISGGPLVAGEVLVHLISSTGNIAAGILSSGSVDATVDATTISDLTGADGVIGISSSGGLLTVTDSAIESLDASAGAIAFGISGADDLVLSGTEISGLMSGELAFGAGGQASLTMERSTITDVFGADIAVGVNGGDTGRIVNSTITGVSGYAAIGGTDLTVVYSDIVGNGAEDPVSPTAATAMAIELPEGFGKLELAGIAGGDLEVAASPFGQLRADNLTIFGTVVTSPVGVFENCTQLVPVTSAGYNFADDTSCNLTGTGDRQGAGLDPQLGVLAFNGGPTQTMAITNTSPLYDAIPSAACQSGPAAGVTTDQRGVTRPGFTGCDIGAFEIESPIPVNILPKFTG